MEVPLFGEVELANIVLVVVGVLFLLEQGFFWVLGSYPYRYGWILKTWTINPSKISQLLSTWSSEGRLVFKTHEGRREVYFRYRYPALVIGPHLFAGQLTYGKGAIIRIRMGLISAFLVVYLVVFPLVTGGPHLFGLLNSVLVVGFVAWIWFLLIKRLNINNMPVCSAQTTDQPAKGDR